MEPESEVIEIGPTPVTQALVPQRPAAGLALWEPDELRLAIAREEALREVIVSYVRSKLIEGMHYYTLRQLRGGEDSDRRGQEKPSLTKEGALNICHLLHCRPGRAEVEREYHEGGHVTITTMVPILSLRTDQVVAEGQGAASSLESKYAYRWVFPSQIEANERTGLVTKRVKARGEWTTMYRVPVDSPPADVMNVILKMSWKRGLVAGVLALPLVSEIFTQDLEDLPPDEELGGGEIITPETRRARLESRPTPAPTGEPTWTPEQVQRLGSSPLNLALAKRVRYLAPDSKDERQGYLRLAFGDAVRVWADVEALGLSVRRDGLLKLLLLKKDAPPPVETEPDDVPLDPPAETEASQPEPPPSPPELILVEGYAGLESVQALRAWATALGARLALETELARGGADASGPLVTSEQWERCVLAVQAAATPGEEDVP
jgi:hypothetical protein